jgi:hypothetical protein
MKLSECRALNDMWMRVRMSLQLISAIASTARRHKELLLFPVLSLFTTATLFLGLFVLGNALIVQAEDVSPIALVALAVAFTSLFLYLQCVSTTFFDVALTFAAFRALRDEHTSPLAALAHALARVRAIVAYTGAAVAAGVLVAPLAMISRSRTVFNRLLPSLDLAWSVVPLMAIPVLIRHCPIAAPPARLDDCSWRSSPRAVSRLSASQAVRARMPREQPAPLTSWIVRSPTWSKTSGGTLADAVWRPCSIRSAPQHTRRVCVSSHRAAIS